ncbi:hypothetical protein L6R50_09815 [Myxococcota bacterium]|nr:hypothetical protein [Myxococcota bacterium]
MEERLIGKVLWYRPQSGQGMVRADDGRRFFFRDVAARQVGPEEGLRVIFEVGRPEGGGSVEALSLALEGGHRRLEAVMPDAQRLEKKRQEGAARANVERGPRAKKAPPPSPRPLPNVAMQPGTAVNHPMWGPGHVVAATATVVSVEFLSGIRKSFKPEDLADLSGPAAPKAPEKRVRTPARTEPPAGQPVPLPPHPRIIRRSPDGEK